jgi:hypothetical protein
MRNELTGKLTNQKQIVPEEARGESDVSLPSGDCDADAICIRNGGVLEKQSKRTPFREKRVGFEFVLAGIRKTADESAGGL